MLPVSRTRSGVSPASPFCAVDSDSPSCYGLSLTYVMHEHLLELIELVRPYVDQYGYLILFFGVMLENASLPVPGETILIIAAFYSHSSHGQAHLNLGYVIGLASVGCILGDNISFYLGRRLGRPFIQQYGKYFFITPQRLEQVELFFERHGDKTIFLQRWVTGVRVIGALVAGTTQMPWSRFLVFNCLGAVTWVTAISVLAYLFAVNLPVLLMILSRSGWTLLAVVVGLGLILYLKRRFQMARQAPPA